MCKQCETHPVYEFTNKRKVCKACFLRWFFKKFLYTIRKFKMINKDELIGYVSGGCFRGVVLEEMLNMFAEKAPIEIVKLKGSPSKLPKIPKKVDKLAISNTSDVLAINLIQNLINKKIDQIKPVERKIIRPLLLFLDKEVLLYAKLRGLKFKKVKEKKDNLGKFLDEMEQKHPEMKRAIVNGCLTLHQNK